MLPGITLGVNTRTTAQTTVFQDGEQTHEYKVDGQYPSTSYIAPTPDTSLSEFFSRPVLIDTRTWAVGQTFNTLDPHMNVWNLFLRNKRVSNRMANIALMRARVHLKITINGNGFYYGRVLAAALPLAATDQMFSDILEYDNTQLSQLPHVFINPTTSTGGEISIPFFANVDYYNVSDKWDDPTVGIDNRIKLYLRQLNPLQSANGSVAPLRINTFMWLSDVETSNITCINPGYLTVQSGDEIDVANATGVVSGPATAVANAAQALKAIPMIRPYAMVADKVATTTANIAKSIGLSRPNMTVQPHPFKQCNSSSLALTTVPDLVQKLTLDDKQSMSIDPKIAGISAMDPMDIVSIAKHESYFTKFDWSVASTGQLYTVAVQPYNLQYDIPLGSHHLTAAAAASLPFQYWGGTMKYRFQVVCSAHHKGRLAVAWDPNYFKDVASLSEYNVNQIRIVDIADTTDFTIDVGWGQPTPFADKYQFGLDGPSATQLFGNTFFATKPRGNGVLSIRVLNELTRPSPDFGATVQVNVFASAGDDFRVAVPVPDILSSGYSVQSGEEQPDVAAMTGLDEPQHEESEMLGTSIVPDHLYAAYIGESIVSLRMLIKRYMRWRVEALSLPAGNVHNIRLPYFPFHRGKVGPDVSVTYPVDGFGYVNTTYLTLIAPCFAACRGSIRYKFLMNNFNSTIAFNNVMEFQRLRNSGGYARGSGAQPTAVSFPRSGVTDSAVEFAGTSTFPSGASGEYAGSLINNMAEIEVPFNSRYKFTTARSLTWWVTNSPLSPDVDSLQVNFTSMPGNLSMFISAGDDFQCYWWLGMPRLFYRAGVPT